MTQTRSSFAKFAWVVLAYNLLVILIGAFVRATGSGAGCGAHWPLCNGVVLPRPEQIETVIEFTHRITSGGTLILVALMVFYAWRLFPKGNPIRLSAALTGLFTITEALVGAGLVLFHLVEDNDSVARAISMMVHLINTFLLIGWCAVTAWWATNGIPEKTSLHGVSGGLIILGFVLMLLLGASGAVTALGDTLYPSSSLAEGLQEDFSPTAHYLIRMRVFHPAIAVSVGLYLAAVTWWIRRVFNQHEIRETVERLSNYLFGLYVLQIILGMINVALLAPVWMQLVHLLVSTLIWITFVLMGTVVFGSARLAPGLEDHPVHYPVGEVTK